VTPFGTAVVCITRSFLISHNVFSVSHRWDGHVVKMGTDKNFSGLLNFGGETNGKHSTWNTEEQTESYNLR